MDQELDISGDIDRAFTFLKNCAQQMLALQGGSLDVGMFEQLWNTNTSGAYAWAQRVLDLFEAAGTHDAAVGYMAQKLPLTDQSLITAPTLGDIYTKVQAWKTACGPAIATGGLNPRRTINGDGHIIYTEPTAADVTALAASGDEPADPGPLLDAAYQAIRAFVPLRPS